MEEGKSNRLKYGTVLLLLVASALLLGGRLLYSYLADAERFPINTIKVSASYEHLTHEALEDIIGRYANESFFTLPVRQLIKALSELEWVNEVQVSRIWPDTLKLRISEKQPIARWNDALVTETGIVFNKGKNNENFALPLLHGPVNQYNEVLQVYKKLSNILSTYDLHLARLDWRENHAWELVLDNGVVVRLGKCCLEQRITRFCKAYPAVFAEKPEQLASVDLRYPHGMAVQWKQ